MKGRITLVAFMMFTVFSLGLTSIPFSFAGNSISIEEEFADCFVHVEWDNPLSFTSPTEPTIPIVFDGECQAGNLSTVPTNPTLECGVSSTTSSGADLCRIKVPNFIDNLDTKIIFIDITFDPETGPTPSIAPDVTCFDPDHTSGSAPGNLIVEELDGPGLFIYDFECKPNPDWEQIDIILDFNVEKIQIWTTSFGEPIPIGGINIPIDQTALLLAGVSSISMWMIPVVIAGVGIGVFVIKRRK